MRRQSVFVDLLKRIAGLARAVGIGVVGGVGVGVGVVVGVGVGVGAVVVVVSAAVAVRGKRKNLRLGNDNIPKVQRQSVSVDLLKRIAGLVTVVFGASDAVVLRGGLTVTVTVAVAVVHWVSVSVRIWARTTIRVLLAANCRRATKRETRMKAYLRLVKKLHKPHLAESEGFILNGHWIVKADRVKGALPELHDRKPLPCAQLIEKEKAKIKKTREIIPTDLYWGSSCLLVFTDTGEVATWADSEYLEAFRRFVFRHSGEFGDPIHLVGDSGEIDGLLMPVVGPEGSPAFKKVLLRLREGVSEDVWMPYV